MHEFVLIKKYFNENFGDELYMIEEHASDDHSIKSFGYSKKLIGTDDLLKNLSTSVQIQFQFFLKHQLLLCVLNC